MRRQAASTSRVNVPGVERRARSGRGGSAPGSPWRAGSGDGPPRSRHSANRVTTSSSVGTRGLSGTSAAPASRISIRWSGEATAFLVGAHQQTTWDLARVIGDVQQPQPLAGLLVLPAAAVVGPAGAAAADVEAALPVVVVEQRPGRLRHEPVGHGGEVDDGVLEPLARMDRHQLHGGGVGVEAAGAFGAAAGPALGDLLAQPGQQRDQAVPLGEGHLVERLADVAQVGEPALAADLGQHPRREPARRSRPRARRRCRGW